MSVLDKFARVTGQLLTRTHPTLGQPVEMIVIPRGLLEDLQYILNDYQDRIESDHLLGADDFLSGADWEVQASDHKVAAIATAEVVSQLIGEFIKGQASAAWWQSALLYIIAPCPGGGE